MDTSLIVNGETRFTNLPKMVRMSGPSNHDDDDDDHDNNDDNAHTQVDRRQRVDVDGHDDKRQ